MPGRVLVVDDVPANIRLLEAKLSNEYYEVLSASNGQLAIEIARQESPDVILLDVMMPEMDGFEVCRRLKSDPVTSMIPIVLVTALSDTKDRVEGLRSGADDFLTKPVQDVPLFARVRSLIRLKMMMEEWSARDKTARQFGVMAEQGAMPSDDGRSGHLLLIEQNAIEASNILDVLTQDGHEILGATNIEEGLALSQDHAFDLIMVSTAIQEDVALRLCSKLRIQEKTRHTPILLLADVDDKGKLAQALDLGVNDYIITPADRDELLARSRIQVRRARFQQMLRQNYEQSLTMALIDQLTGLYNRRYFESHAQELLDRAKKTDKPLSVLAIDIDFFKKINDTHGHQAGDAVLKELAQRLTRNVRNLDLVARLGGEEFVIIMPDTNLELAVLIADRLRLAVASEPVSFEGKSLSFSISVGLSASIPPMSLNHEELMKQADTALYEAKNAGRNRIVLYKQPGQ